MSNQGIKNNGKISEGEKPRAGGSEMPWEDVAQILPKRTTCEVKLKWLNELDPRLKQGAWSQEEVTKLEEAVARYNKRQWLQVAQAVGRRTPLQCFRKYQDRHRKEILNAGWNSEEDLLLQQLVYKYGEKEWKLIASEMHKRSAEQLLHRWTKTKDPNIAHGRWHNEEDVRLIIAMRYYGGEESMLKKKRGKQEGVKKNEKKTIVVSRKSYGAPLLNIFLIKLIEKYVSVGVM
eukprot:UN24220